MTGNPEPLCGRPVDIHLQPDGKEQLTHRPQGHCTDEPGIAGFYIGQ